MVRLFIGGEIDDSAAALAIDSTGNVYVRDKPFHNCFHSRPTPSLPASTTGLTDSSAMGL